MLLATAAKDIVASIPGEKQGEIYIVGIKSEEWVAILHSVMRSYKSIGPWRHHKPFHLLYTGALRQESGKPLSTEVEGDILWKHLKAQHSHKRSLFFPASGWRLGPGFESLEMLWGKQGTALPVSTTCSYTKQGQQCWGTKQLCAPHWWWRSRYPKTRCCMRSLPRRETPFTSFATPSLAILYPHLTYSLFLLFI